MKFLCMLVGLALIAVGLYYSTKREREVIGPTQGRHYETIIKDAYGRCLHVSVIRHVMLEVECPQ